MTATMCRLLIVHQYCFRAVARCGLCCACPRRENSAYTMSDCRCSLRLSGVETAGSWVGVGVHAPWSSGSEKCRVLVFVLGVLFEEQGSCLHVCFLWHNLVSQHTFG